MVTDVLMSIRPAYAEAIFAGTKRVELRRRRPSFGTGTRVVVYSSSPRREIQGTFRVGSILTDDLDSLWQRIGDVSGIDRTTFDAYFTGCSAGSAIEVLEPKRVQPAPLTIPPPQSYLFLRPRERRHQRVLRAVVAAHAT